MIDNYDKMVPKFPHVGSHFQKLVKMIKLIKEKEEKCLLFIQRVALIRTLATNPDLLLLDEPFSALDYQSRLAVSDDVYRIIKKEEKTVIMVTHDLAEAISMADRIVVLSNRPSKVKKIFTISLSDKDTPIHNRKCKEFSTYYDLLWKEIDFHV